MYLEKVCVPDFRALKNVEICFERELKPSIFPLGSLNGGGKSTLLQLIFVLLHCSTHPDRIFFLQNLLNGFKTDQDSNRRILATIDIWENNNRIQLSFFVCKESFFQDLFDEKSLNNDIIQLELSIREILEIIQTKGERENTKINNIQLYKFFSNILNNHKIIYICETSPAIQNLGEKEILICQFKNIDMNKARLFLQEISDKIFLAAHVSQVFLFLPPDSRKFLFKTQGKEELDENDYYGQLRKEKPNLPGFFTYDFMAVDILIDSFIKARDLDFEKARETGEYGENYKRLLEDLNHVLSNKKININKDLSGVTFQINLDNTELYAEDLSHGELKRLCIYMWIKHHQIENSIVLMDELEIAFHPDWQYQIVRDIEEWSPTNQYILATHSYELCQAVTPAHVKELEPKLKKNPK